ncbi:DEAD/DEAH box helicase (plasmid) [Paenibacillus rhizovicinus]|uniref:DEAD/DEAH box helicase n=1 Tax=Paenibacillus rhizovicinus TaxID=2704463 RepID=A0A6C0PBB0_9BACL|nr:DEAD/DEAH box helicase [Paenibacillus rhizovicinus]QHW35736.1 DEAD/DEAH box helicase [Paenibacillus rhizovicinus]
MIQVRSQYNNIYVKILDSMETFDLTLEKVRSIPDRSFNMATGEWMFPRTHIGHLLYCFNNQISWMTPLAEIVQDVPIDNELVNQHLQWESEGEFKNFLIPMYPYQKVGSNFLIDRGSGAVFDGCGLGKTPQLIGAIMKLNEMGKAEKALIVTLNSLKRQWAKEIEKFTGETALAATGTSDRRGKILREFGRRKEIKFLVVNYEMLRSESFMKILKSIKIDVVALDEAQKIKTGVTDAYLDIKPSQNAMGAHELKHIPYRFIATATPLQGKAEEVWSLFYFLDENILGPWEYFRERYCTYSKKYGITGYQNQGELYYRIAPYFIRRTKDMPEIQQQLPEVQHSHVFLEMTDLQDKLHNYLLQQLADVKEQARGINGYTFLNGQSVSPQEAKDYFDALAQGYTTFLIETCDSPELIYNSASQMAQRIRTEFGLDPKSLKSPKIEHLKDFYENMTFDEPKSKVVIFTRFEGMAQLIHKQLPNSVIYHGEMSEGGKQFAVERFREDPEIKAFISTDAGSTGLNLQVANYLIHVDMPWDHTWVEQRNGRIDRTGNQFSNVTIYYYCMGDSYDEQVLEIINRKSELAAAIIEGGRDSHHRGPDVHALAIERMLKRKNKQLA